MANQKFTQVQDIPDWLKGPYQDLISSAQSLTGEDYPLYQGSRVAGLSDLQQQAVGATPGLATSGKSLLGLSEALAAQGAQALPQTNISNYMNPYMEQAIQPALQDLERAYMSELNRTGAQAASSGAFGGSRQALLESQLGRNYLEGRGDLMSQGLAAAYESAINAFGADQNRALAASGTLGTLGETTQAMDLRSLNALLGTGGLQQAQSQAGLDVAYGDFLEQRDWPYGQLSFLQGILGGTPTVGTTRETTSGGGGNKTGQIIGGVSTGLGLADTVFDLGTKIAGIFI